MLEDLQRQLAGVFRIERELGGGAMSRVFVAEELALGRMVVVKVLPPDLGHAVSASRFEREIRVAARLQHPHIVPLLAAGQLNGALYYTMPLVEGESLRALLARSQELPVVQALRIMREIADALAYAHREGIVHRDIKPDNVLLSHQHAMVTDFGVARALAEAGSNVTATGTGVAVGTPAYMAPEQAVGDARLDHRADLYALGVLAYEMLAGQPPFQAANFQALVAAHLTQEPTPLAQVRSSVPEALAAIVHRCLEKRAADRFQSAAEVVAALDQLSLDSGARPTAPLPPKAVTRRQALVGGAAAGLLGFALGRQLPFTAASDDQDISFQRLTFRRGMIRTARFAPDFQTVLFGALWDGDVCRTYSVRPESPESAPLSLPAAAPLAVSSSGELALALGEHMRGIMPYGTLARVPLAGGAPRALTEDVKFADWSPDGRELAVVRRGGQQDLLEYPLGTPLARASTEIGGFSFVRVSPRGDAVAAFELDDRAQLFGRVIVVARDGSVRRSEKRYFNVFGLAWNGGEVWFTAAESLPLFRNTVFALSPSGRVRVVARVPGNTSLHDIAPDGRVLIARTDDRSGFALRARGSTRERDLSWLDSSNIDAITPDGEQILFTEAGVGGGPKASAYLRRNDGSPAVRLSDGYAKALSPDGRWALVKVDEQDDGLTCIPTGAGESRRIAPQGLRVTDGCWLGDSEQLVLRAGARGAPARLYLSNADGSAVTAITPSGVTVNPNSWALAPDSSAVAVSDGTALRIYGLPGATANRDSDGRSVPGDWNRWSVIGWITQGLLLAESPAAGGELQLVNPLTGRASLWADIRPIDPAGVMTLDLSSMVITPDGSAYGYIWHRALSDLYLVTGWR